MRQIKNLMLLVLLVSCTNKENLNNIHGMVTTVNSPAQKVKNNSADSLKQKVEAVLHSDTSKIYGVVETNGFVYYKEFYQEQPETDIGRQFLRVLEDSIILWSYELPRLAKVNDNGSIIVITDVETNKITLRSIKNGNKIKEITFKEDIFITDGTDVLISANYIYISVNNEDNEATAVRKIFLSDYTQETIEFTSKGYYSLKRDNKSRKIGVYNTNSLELILPLAE